MACSTAHVSAFCRAVTAKVIPLDFLGDHSNTRVLMYWIDQFVSLRRFETLTLHQVLQKLEVSRLGNLARPEFTDCRL
jgi:telomerase reverse transcriptase